LEGFEDIDDPGLREDVLRSDRIETSEGACNAVGVGLLEGFDFVAVAIAENERTEDTLSAALTDTLDDALDDALDESLNAGVIDTKKLVEGLEVSVVTRFHEGVLRSDRIEFPEGACNAVAEEAEETEEVAVILACIA